MNVDVYGKCGPLGHENIAFINCEGEACSTDLGKKYRFYLAFENSMCGDYVTEKLYKVMRQEIIPVVLNRASMGSVAPPHSYISVTDFATIDQLAAYLQVVAEDKELFASYFWWREFYRVVDLRWMSWSMHSFYWCSLCDKLWSLEGRTRVVHDLHRFWVEQARCKFVIVDSLDPGGSGVFEFDDW